MDLAVQKMSWKELPRKQKRVFKYEVGAGRLPLLFNFA